VNAAIGPEAGKFPLYTFDIEDKTIPAWLKGSSSLSRDHVLHCARHLSGIEDRIIEIQVELITVEMLLARIEIKCPDIVVIDAEGYDASIIRQFDLIQLAPKMVVYERESMSPKDADEIQRHFESADFFVYVHGQDSVAIRKNTKLASKLSLEG
jgi:hypothetical protein